MTLAQAAVRILHPPSGSPCPGLQLSGPIGTRGKQSPAPPSIHQQLRAATIHHTLSMAELMSALITAFTHGCCRPLPAPARCELPPLSPCQAQQPPDPLQWVEQLLGHRYHSQTSHFPGPKAKMVHMHLRRGCQCCGEGGRVREGTWWGLGRLRAAGGFWSLQSSQTQAALAWMRVLSLPCTSPEPAPQYDPPRIQGWVPPAEQQLC